MMKQFINYPHLANQVFGIPQYASRQIMDSVKAVLVPRLMGEMSATALMAFEPDDQPESEPIQTGSVAVIPVHGLLVPRRGQITQACTELTSYERIRAQFSKALNDPNVSEIVLDLYTGGGAVSGCKELADYIFASRDIKPITAIVNFNAYSAGYFIASACSRVVVSQTSGVGSIGVILEHMETSKMEEQIGLKFTTFYRGDFKNAGSPHEPLTDESITYLDQLIDDAYETFTSSVAQYRGIDVQRVIDTQARTFFGQAAVDAGLADELSDPQTAINNIAAKYSPKPVSSSIQLRAEAMRQQVQL
ncbi:S49 family peptidase [Yersinia intermedia]|uniref:S49 family peptidase n=1 Tax=Yersinia intermedia TaxID=631 RepID=UPI00299D62BB|nr:S49 family peptidase [Yersinia intermedia]